MESSRGQSLREIEFVLKIVLIEMLNECFYVILILICSYTSEPPVCEVIISLIIWTWSNVEL